MCCLCPTTDTVTRSLTRNSLTVFLLCSAVGFDADPYEMFMFSSFTPLDQIKCPGAATSPLNPAITPDTIRRLNWMINTWYNPAQGINPSCTLPDTVRQGTFQSRTTTRPGTYRPANKWDMQAAVWALTGSNRYAGKSSNDDVVNCILWNTYNTKIYPDYKPPCDGLVSVILVPCNEDGRTPAQITIAQVTVANVPVPCDCKVRHTTTAWLT